MPETGQEDAAPRQLSLLQWDLLAAGRGYCCLAALDFAQARSCFAEILAVLPAQDEALRGMQLLHEWEETLREAQELPAQHSIPSLWRKIQRMPDLSTANIQEFRRALIRRLLEMMTGAADLFHPPDLCCGALLLELNEPAAAERELRKMLTRHPRDGRLYALLALALRRQGRREAAPALTSALLLCYLGEHYAFVPAR
jgi:Flp pilus assembly protein TadD